MTTTREPLLDRAKADLDGLLAAVQPAIVEYRDGSSRMYRARFVGFDGKSSAWSACRSLKRKGYGCWAMQ
ncbi:hypothetical protein C5748_10915 [Phyllobacterium phragmitis]|uniref:SPOR domain-containing protein n=1 Tax=Phyllobacterium phragmitis TaxID=2670329 RepID=A0A2S9ITB0_9HYPH|nr:SPOR domain-containing protein [Phyllobacterium phragmitis]PRD43741.1 hypothetical protein C5748_10915 [Phyllobacterium phragmitis]